ncbi:MAG: winged helix-turn-helix domain-containing protein [Actinomycetota bacterium]|nr:winged helix-turn-helix domain-containing protein [Actinomycetota bacterium]
MEATPDTHVLRIGPLEVRLGEDLALADGRPLILSVREHAVLVELARRADRIVSREDLYGLAWGRELRPGDRSVDVYVHRLRAKLEAALPGWELIHTHIGFGYRLSAERSHAFHIDATAR